ncbi:MAG TPA: hypothetical protein PKA64_00095 [Myxococcota bacterium]|nr:hypothetical protein [Myxococcota bacterium]
MPNPSDNDKSSKGGGGGGDTPHPSTKGGALGLHGLKGDGSFKRELGDVPAGMERDAADLAAADVPDAMKRTGNDGGPGDAVANPEGGALNVHGLKGSAEADVAAVPEKQKRTGNEGGPADPVKNPAGGALHVHGQKGSAEADRGAVPEKQKRTGNEGGPADPVKAPPGGAFKIHGQKGQGDPNAAKIPEKQKRSAPELAAAKVPEKQKRAANDGGPADPVKGPQRQKQTAEDRWKERPPRQPPTQKKKDAQKGAAASAKDKGGSKSKMGSIANVIKRPERMLPAEVKKAMGAVVAAGAAAKTVMKAAQAISGFKPPALPGFMDPPSMSLPSSSGKMELEDENGGVIQFSYNPTQFSLDRSVSWEDTRAMKEPYGILNFTGGSSDTINFTTMIDNSEDGADEYGAVLDQVQALYELTNVQIVEANYARPPTVKLTWGDFAFVGVITAIKVDFTMFAEDGEPLRADVTVTMMGRSFNDDSSATTFFAPFTTA